MKKNFNIYSLLKIVPGVSEEEIEEALKEEDEICFRFIPDPLRIEIEDWDVPLLDLNEFLNKISKFIIDGEEVPFDNDYGEIYKFKYSAGNWKLFRGHVVYEEVIEQ